MLTVKPSARTVVWIALALIAVQTVIRIWLVARGYFYWDDLILIGRASTESIWSWSYLMQDHDGHLMPGAFLVAGVITELSPLNWVIPAITLVVGQLLVSLAVLRMVMVIAGRDRPILLVPLVFFLFTPMTVPAYTWWAAGLNTLPLQFAMAVVVADVVQLCRGQVADRRRVIIRSLVVFVVALAFFEKSLLILPVAAVAAVLWVHVNSSAEGPGLMRSIRTAWSAARELWIAMAAIAAAWMILYFASTSIADGHSIGQAMSLTWRSINRGLVPAGVGGPWFWTRWLPSPPMAQPQDWMIAAGWVVLIAAVAYVLWTRRGAALVLVAVFAYVVVLQIPLFWSRTSEFTSLELAQTLRYLPDTALVITVAMALLVSAPRRRLASAGAPGHSQRSAALPARSAIIAAAVVGVAYIGSSLVSTAEFADEWNSSPTEEYMANARASLAQAAGTRMLDHALPLLVILPVTYPDNQVGKVFAALDQRPTFGPWTDKLQVLDDQGHLVAGDVTAARTFGEGAGACDRPEITGPSSIPLNGPLLDWTWVVALPYCANTDGTVRIGLTEDASLEVPVKAGLHTVFVQVEGSGSEVQLRPVTPGLQLHVGQGRVGELVRAP
ncbi:MULTISPECIES: hypothetical protein [Actinomycetes]|uniref:hypothetical protein n=1 Tax=Actinomycetes TaxID=1760 RepID=UPI000A8AC58B|nr:MULTISPECIES: hypothetical protein [Actinomycetes]